MIAHLRGKVIGWTLSSIVLDVNGVGYEVFLDAISLGKLQSQDGEITLHILTLVKDDDIQLIGFFDLLSRDFFKLLLSVKGIGSKHALSIMSSVEIKELIKYIWKEDIGKISMISGIGKKMAERMIVELKDKVKKLPLFEEEEGETQKKLKELQSALANLGFKFNDIERVLNSAKEYLGDEPIEELLKKALRELQK